MQLWVIRLLLLKGQTIGGTILGALVQQQHAYHFMSPSSHSKVENSHVI